MTPEQEHLVKQIFRPCDDDSGRWVCDIDELRTFILWTTPAAIQEALRGETLSREAFRVYWHPRQATADPVFVAPAPAATSRRRSILRGLLG